jgi:hypothetical protein
MIEGFLRQAVREKCTPTDTLTVLRHLAQLHALH